MSNQNAFIEVFEAQKAFFTSGVTRATQFRLEMLSTLERLINDNTDAICDALFSDLRKPKQESLIAEVAVALEEIRLAKKNLHRWMSPQRAPTPLILFPSSSRIHYEPLGVVFIIGPWNYPFQLLIAPLVGAIAAGNCAILKPSELTINTSRLVASLIKKYFKPNYLSAIEGGVSETTQLLSLKFNHIFFTGSTTVGKIVMQAAAHNLIPVTLELGGKSPVIVCEDADLDLAARRIVWGKFYNAGQTCVAPDYLYAHTAIVSSLLEKMKENIVSQFGAEPQKSQSFARIVNLRNHQRLSQFLEENKTYWGGKVDAADLYIEPTILKNVSWNDPVMKEEIFGPILPTLTYENIEDAFSTINSRPKPLSAYLFSQSKEKQKAFIEKVVFGGGCINDVMVHLSNPHVPFGGVGDSGLGNYHGRHSFFTFSHSKSVMHRSGFFDFSARYAPYGERKMNFMRRIFRV